MGRIVRGRRKKMQNRQIDNKTTKQVRIDAGMHRLLKLKATESGMTIKQFLEEYLADALEVKSDKYETPGVIK